MKDTSSSPSHFDVDEKDGMMSVGASSQSGLESVNSVNPCKLANAQQKCADLAGFLRQNALHLLQLQLLFSWWV